MIKAIAFDLDDTLLDTTGLLVKKASAEAFQVLINAGLKINLQACEALRIEWIKAVSHKEVLERLATEFGNEQTIAQAHKAVEVFYNPKIPAQLPLIDGAEENLVYLQKKYQLFLVTAGQEKAQMQKAQALGICKYFNKIFVVDSLIKKRKLTAFQEILQMAKIKPEELLCIGNSLASEIIDGQTLGAITCYFEFGEDRGARLESLSHIKPHFHIREHRELISACQL